jgi:hypothetical protein
MSAARDELSGLQLQGFPRYCHELGEIEVSKPAAAAAAGGPSNCSSLSMVCNCLRSADQSVLLDRLEEVLDDVAADRAPEVRALQTGVPEVKAGQGARQFDVPDGVAKARVLARRLGHPAVEGERDPIGAEERRQRRRDR